MEGTPKQKHVELIELAKQAKEVRDAQKAYFKCKSDQNLFKSKTLEQNFDKLIKGILDTQSKLF